MEGNVRIVDNGASPTTEPEPGVLGEEVGGVQRGGPGTDYSDPRGLRAGIINEAQEAADNALAEVRRSLDLLAVVDRDAAQRKSQPVVKAVSELVEHLEDKT